MTRPIKFRVWDKQQRTMHDDVLADEFGPKMKAMGSEPHEFLRMLTGSYNDYVVMQYTGLKDKNGKEIWEGDIVHYIEVNPERDLGNWYVEYFAPEWMVTSKKGLIGMSAQAWKVRMEVIGNIYENPDLLK